MGIYISDEAVKIIVWKRGVCFGGVRASKYCNTEYL